MNKLWVSYAWADDSNGDVEFVCQMIEKVGIEVNLDRWRLGAGKRLWPQIEQFIIDPSKSDAWAFYATQTSITREACLEELNYALDRALHTRGGAFPLIGITPSYSDIPLFPASIRTRLCVSLEDADWLERIKAAVEGHTPDIPRKNIHPYHVQFHQTSSRYFIEVRPRAGTWYPFFIGVPVAEKEGIDPMLVYGPSGSIPLGSIMTDPLGGPEEIGGWFLLRSHNMATPTISFFLQCKEIPSRILFGKEGGDLHYVEIKR